MWHVATWCPTTHECTFRLTQAVILRMEFIYEQVGKSEVQLKCIGIYFFRVFFWLPTELVIPPKMSNNKVWKWPIQSV